MIDQKLIHSQCNSKDLDDIEKGLDSLINNYNEFADKTEAWKDLIDLTDLPDLPENTKKENDDTYQKRINAIKIKAIKFLTQEIPNKLETKDYDELLDVLRAIRLVPFDLWIEKDLIWNYLIKLIDDERPRFSTDGASVLRSMFIYVENKKGATDDLFRLTESKNKYTQYYATFTLGYRFEENGDKQRVWRKICDLSHTDNIIILRGIAWSIGYVIRFLSTDDEKNDAWEILNQFLHNQDDIIKLGSVKSLSLSFHYLLDRHRVKAIRMLYQLIKESKNQDIISMVAITLGNNYSDIIDKNSAHKCLMKLATKNSLIVNCFANHSLGRVYIYKTATSDKGERKENLKEAIKYYQAAEDCSSYQWCNPSQFCKVFYNTLFDLFYDKIVLTEEEIIERFNLSISSVTEQKIREKLLNILKHSAFLLNESKNVDYNSTESDKIFDELKNCCDTIIWTLDEVQTDYPFLKKTVQEIIKEENPDLIKIIRDDFESAASKNSSYNSLLLLVNKLERDNEKNIEYIDQIVNEIKRLALSEIDETYSDKLDDILKEKNSKKKLELLAKIKFSNFLVPSILRTVEATYITVEATHITVEDTNKTVKDTKINFDQVLSKFNELEVSTASSKITGEIILSGGPNIGIFGAVCEIHIPILEADRPDIINKLKSCTTISVLPQFIVDKIKNIFFSPNNKQKIEDGSRAHEKIIYLNA